MAAGLSHLLDGKVAGMHEVGVGQGARQRRLRRRAPGLAALAGADPGVLGVNPGIQNLWVQEGVQGVQWKSVGEVLWNAVGAMRSSGVLGGMLWRGGLRTQVGAGLWTQLGAGLWTQLGAGVVRQLQQQESRCRVRQRQDVCPTAADSP